MQKKTVQGNVNCTACAVHSFDDKNFIYQLKEGEIGVNKLCCMVYLRADVPTNILENQSTKDRDELYKKKKMKQCNQNESGLYIFVFDICKYSIIIYIGLYILFCFCFS